jgi:5-methylcytosine-specific restriction endonuclease McrA
VVPRSRGGKLTWTNTVSACLDCNYRKGSTPIEDLPKIGMRLRSQPRAPSYHELQYKAKQYKKTQVHPDWETFLERKGDV